MGYKAILDMISSCKFETDTPWSRPGCGVLERFWGFNHKVGFIVAVGQRRYAGQLIEI